MPNLAFASFCKACMKRRGNENFKQHSERSYILNIHAEVLKTHHHFLQANSGTCSTQQHKTKKKNIKMNCICC